MIFKAKWYIYLLHVRDFVVDITKKRENVRQIKNLAKKPMKKCTKDL